MTATVFLQVNRYRTQSGLLQAEYPQAMSAIFSISFYSQTGLVLYWLTNNILSTAQQWYINKQTLT